MVELKINTESQLFQQFSQSHLFKRVFSFSFSLFTHQGAGADVFQTFSPKTHSEPPMWWNCCHDYAGLKEINEKSDCAGSNVSPDVIRLWQKKEIAWVEDLVWVWCRAGLQWDNWSRDVVEHTLLGSERCQWKRFKNLQNLTVLCQKYFCSSSWIPAELHCIIHF